VKKDRFYSSGGTRVLKFVTLSGDIAQLKTSGKTLTISIGPGLAKNASKCVSHHDLSVSLYPSFCIFQNVIFICVIG